MTETRDFNLAKRPHAIARVARLIQVDEPVLIAPRGSDYHDAKILVRSWVGPVAWLDRPRCGAHAERWVAVDRGFAELLGRGPCAVCATLDPKITDAEEAPETSPEIPGPTTKEQP
jgi:hypothetical protein